MRSFLRPRSVASRACAVLCVGVLLVPPGSLVPVPTAHATIPVVDVGSIGQLMNTEINNDLRHVEDIAKYIQQVDNQIEQLRRMGDPNTYIGMLQIQRLTNDITTISAGIGRGIGEIQSAANGPNAMKYTANGIYRDLSSIPDKAGNAMRWNYNEFKQFDTVGQLATQYNTDLQKYNQQMASFGTQYQTLLQKLNSAGSQTEAQKIIGQMHTLSSQMTSAGQILHASADRVAVQTQLNQQMSARDAQAQQQIDAQNAQIEGQAIINGLQQKYGQ